MREAELSVGRELDMANQSDAALKLKRLRERTGLSVRKLAGRIGRAASSYAFYEDSYKKAYLPLDLVQELVPVFEPFGIEPEEVLALAGVVKGEALLGRRSRANDNQPQNATRIAELDVRASAGGGLAHETDESEPVVAEWQMPSALLRAQTTAPAANLRIITVYGDSMVPDFLPGERVLVDTGDRRPSPPGVFVLWDGFGLVLKRLEMIPYSEPAKVRLFSANSQYGAYEQPLEDVVINGRVIGKWQWT